MPRAPHSMALLAGRPRAKRSVLSSRICFCRSTPCSSEISTRDTLATGARCGGEGCQTKASAEPRSAADGGGGARRSSASAMRMASSVRRWSIG